MEKELDKKIIEEIKSKIASLKADKPKRKIFPLVVFGEDGDDKEVYVGYFARPNMMTFDKFLTMSKSQGEVKSMNVLANDCFIDGDRELIDNEDLFIYGLMPQLSTILNSRTGQLATF